MITNAHFSSPFGNTGGEYFLTSVQISKPMWLVLECIMSSSDTYVSLFVKMFDDQYEIFLKTLFSCHCDHGSMC